MGLYDMSGNVEEWATYVFLDKPNASYMGGDRDKLKNGSAIPERGGQQAQIMAQ